MRIQSIPLAALISVVAMPPQPTYASRGGVSHKIAYYGSLSFLFFRLHYVSQRLGLFPDQLICP